MIYRSNRDLFEAMDNKTNCTGCGTRHRLAVSHLVPVSFNKNLQFVLDNVTLHCHTCNASMQDCRIVHLDDFRRSMEHIKHASPTYYQKIINRLNDKSTGKDREVWEKIKHEF